LDIAGAVAHVNVINKTIASIRCVIVFMVGYCTLVVQARQPQIRVWQTRNKCDREIAPAFSRSDDQYASNLKSSYWKVGRLRGPGSDQGKGLPIAAGRRLQSTFYVD